MLFPDPRRRGDIKFKLAKSLPYNRRLLLVAGLLFIGFVLQLLNIFVGAVFLCAATMLMLVDGYTNSTSEDSYKREWRDASFEQLDHICSIARKTKKWDQSFLDVTCVKGFATLVVLAGLITIIGWRFYAAGYVWLTTVVAVDALVLLLPHWITGVRTILTNDPLVIKVDLLLALYRTWEKSARDDEVMQPQISYQLNKNSDIPSDAKLNMKITSLENRFLGLQVQVVLNSVQGVDYPYLYCVLVARPEFGLLEKVVARPPHGLVMEKKHQKDADVVVIRQHTTADSGYHTKLTTIKRIFRTALTEARKLQ